MAKINWGRDEEFINNYNNLKSSRKMGELYHCDKSSVLNHAKQIGYDVNSNKQYKLSQQDKEIILNSYLTKTSTELAEEFKVSRGMITKIWHDNNCVGKQNISNKTTEIDLTNKKFGKWTVLYKSNKKADNGSLYWHCRCECGKEKDVLGYSLRAGLSTSCGEHSNISRGNAKIAKILEQYKIPFEREKIFQSCKDQRVLPFDFYVDNKYLIEYDGEQHYDEQTVFNYEYTHKHDIMKNEWCKNNNIPLIRIPYTHFQNLNIKDLLLNSSQFILK